MSPPTRLLTGGVRLYQRVTAGRPSPCRYVPTCSNYALDAFERHGALRGSALVMRRMARCHPWGGHGWDPVPEGKHH
jgi:putative membrane protein insertion efficiency factor